MELFKTNFFIDVFLMLVLTGTVCINNNSIWLLVPVLIAIIVQVAIYDRIKEDHVRMQLFRVCSVINMIVMVIETIHIYKYVVDSILWLGLMLFSLITRPASVLFKTQKKQ